MDKGNTTYDAIVIGSGPNGLAAAIAIQQQGLSVLLIEGKDQIGGGLRSAELTLPGFVSDICSAIHPLAIASPFFHTLPLHEHGLKYVFPTQSLAHPFDIGEAAILNHDLSATARSLGVDGKNYEELIAPIIASWPKIVDDVLAPLHFPKHPIAMAKFGLKALTSASYLAKTFKTEKAKGLWAGVAAHAIQPLSNLSTSAIGLVLMTAAHLKGWPIPVGGSQNIANALLSYFKKLGGTVQTGTFINSLSELPSSKTILFDIGPKQLLKIAGHTFSSIYKWQLEKYRYGMGVFKIDWALDEQIPFKDENVKLAGTVHLGGTFNEIALGEKLTSQGKYVEKPFVLLAQQSIVDGSRAPAGKHVAWAYCHVPNGSTESRVAEIESQVERFAPGFKDRILAKHTMNTDELEKYNPNYVGGDINGGIIDLAQLFTRPALRSSPYRTSTKGLYICSSSTPPGGGVHGMCGYHAAKTALKDIFNIELKA